ncbi:hypothetical protein [Ornithinimicrobium cerasi]|uniref:hypothetical protein n=1 Tax=Ornithinimicrobium cerasi TaxID=2248773 RepID=UPI000EFF1775|nr:hypothetical protein [Ornithinimicrobium cerasi]
MLALLLSMIFCVVIGAGVVGYVMLEARREGRGAFWTAEGEELIAGARRTTEKVRARSGDLVGSAAERTRSLASRPAARDEVVRDGVVREEAVRDEPAAGRDGEMRHAS